MLLSDFTGTYRSGGKPALPYRQSLAVVEFVGVCYVVSSACARVTTPTCDQGSLRAFDCCSPGRAERLVTLSQGHQKFLRCPLTGQQQALSSAALE